MVMVTFVNFLVSGACCGPWWQPSQQGFSWLVLDTDFILIILNWWDGWQVAHALLMRCHVGVIKLFNWLFWYNSCTPETGKSSLSPPTNPLNAMRCYLSTITLCWQLSSMENEIKLLLFNFNFNLKSKCMLCELL